MSGAAPGVPRVSVVLPTYRREDLLPQVLESVLAQTFPHFEVVVSDNDRSPAVADLVASYRDPRLRYRHNGGNLGPLLGAQAAYRAVRAPLVATLHDDDLWEPQLLERLVPPMEADGSLALAFADVWIMDAAGRVDVARSDHNTRMWRRDRLPAGVHRPFHRLALVDRSLTVAFACVLRRSVVQDLEIPPAVGTAYDLWLSYLACRGGGGALYLPERLARVRQHGGSLTANVALDRAMVATFDAVLADERLAHLRAELLRESAPFRVSLGVADLRRGDRVAARRRLRSGVRARPDARGVLALALAHTPLPAEPALRLLRRVHPRPHVPDTRY